MKASLKSILLALSIVSAGGTEVGASELARTSWQLVNIVSMNDNVDTPSDRSKYTLEFGKDGRALIAADCNQGTGSWVSDSPSQIRFSEIAATRAVCPPGSISEKYLAQFQWVRSYVIKKGHLFLATMADGSIVEFEPASQAKAAATVLGEKLYGDETSKLRSHILTRLFDQYAQEQGIEVQESEIIAFIEKMKSGMAEKGLVAEDELTEKERNEATEVRRQFATSIIRHWKINKALYAAYGGRIIYQQLGPEPLDAYHRFLEERQEDGAFTIREQSVADTFWRYFTNDTMHSFIEPGSLDERRAFSVPPWKS